MPFQKGATIPLVGLDAFDAIVGDADGAFDEHRGDRLLIKVTMPF